MSKYLTKDQKEKVLKATTFEELKDAQFGKLGTPERDILENECDFFVLGEHLKMARKSAGMTQEELAKKIGTKKSYISRVENGKTDIQLSTLFKIFSGLGKRIRLTIM